MNYLFMNYVFCSSAASSAVMLLVGWYESHPAVKILGAAMLALIYVELNDMHVSEFQLHCHLLHLPQ